MKKLTKDSLKPMPYNRRLLECCFLLKQGFKLKKHTTIEDFWKNREYYYSCGHSTMEYYIKKICQMCHFSLKRDNYLLIYTFAHFGVWRTTKWLLRSMGASSKQREEQNLPAPLMKAYLALNYYYHLNLLNPKWLDVSIGQFTIEVMELLNRTGMAKNYTKVPDKNTEPEEFEAFMHYLNVTLPDLVENFKLKEEENNVTDKRDRQMKRHYFYWRWRKGGLTLFETGKNGIKCKVIYWRRDMIELAWMLW
jgi:hypothetical protein